MSFEPELGQMVFGQPTYDVPVPDFAESLIDGLARRWGIAFWNKNQREWSDWEAADFCGLHVRPYSWSDECENPDNLWIDGHPLRIRWYKHLGRSMSANMELTPKEWAEWHDLAVKEIRSFDGETE